MDETALTLTRHKLTVQDYHRMGDAGILTEDDRIELIEGELIDMAPMGQDHHASVIALNTRFVLAFGVQAAVLVQGSVRLDNHSEPQPDVLVLRPREGGYWGKFPSPEDVLVVIEVADSSLRYDRSVKLPLYARAGIPECWMVDLQRRVIAVHRRPGGGAYGEMGEFGPGDSIVLDAAPEITMVLDGVLG